MKAMRNQPMETNYFACILFQKWLIISYLDNYSYPNGLEVVLYNDMVHS